MAPLAVLMDHDGGVDDYLATVLLMTMEHVDPLAVVVTPADCYPRAAVSATRKILDLMERWTVPVGESTVRGVNPFPRLFRRDSFTVDALPILNDRETVRAPVVPEPGQEFMARLDGRRAGSRRQHRPHPRGRTGHDRRVERLLGSVRGGSRVEDEHPGHHLPVGSDQPGAGDA